MSTKKYQKKVNEEFLVDLINNLLDVLLKNYQRQPSYSVKNTSILTWEGIAASQDYA